MYELLPALKKAQDAVPPLKQAEEAWTQEEPEMPFLTRGGKKEKEEMEEGRGGRSEERGGRSGGGGGGSGGECATHGESGGGTDAKDRDGHPTPPISTNTTHLLISSTSKPLSIFSRLTISSSSDPRGALR
jgi:hypothetical protein